MTVEKKVVTKELLDGLLADYRKPEDLIGENGLLKQLTKLLVERALQGVQQLTQECHGWGVSGGNRGNRFVAVPFWINFFRENL